MIPSKIFGTGDSSIASREDESDFDLMTFVAEAESLLDQIYPTPERCSTNVAQDRQYIVESLDERGFLPVSTRKSPHSPDWTRMRSMPSSM